MARWTWSNRRSPARPALGVLAAFSLVLSGCGADAAKDAAKESDGAYKIGALLDLTGAYSALGETEKEALGCFVDHIKASGGVNGRQLELEVVDSRTNEPAAVNGLRRLAENGAVAVIGPSGTSTGTAVKPVSSSLDIPVVVPASGTSIVQPLPEAEWMFKTFPDAQYAREALLSFAEELGASSVAGLAPNNTYGQDGASNLAEVAAKRGLDFVGKELYEPNTTDFAPQLTKLRSSGADAVVVMDVPPATSVIAQNAQQVGMDDMRFLFDVGSAGPQFIKIAGGAAEGAYVVGTKALVADAIPETDPQHDAIQAYAGIYTKCTGKEPNQYSALVWDALQLIVNALKTANVDPSDVTKTRATIRDALQNTQGFPGVISAYNYSATNHSGQGAEGLALLQVRNGEFTLAGTLTPDGGVQLVR